MPLQSLHLLKTFLPSQLSVCWERFATPYTCIQWLRMFISAFHIVPTVCMPSHDFQSGYVLSHWLLYLGSIYLFCTLMTVTALIFPLDSSCAIDMCMHFPRVEDDSLDICSCKLKSHVLPMKLFLIKESFLSPELHVDTRTLHCVTHIHSSYFQVKYFSQPLSQTQYLSTVSFCLNHDNYYSSISQPKHGIWEREKSLPYSSLQSFQYAGSIFPLYCFNDYAILFV